MPLCLDTTDNERVRPFLDTHSARLGPAVFSYIRSPFTSASRSNDGEWWSPVHIVDGPCLRPSPWFSALNPCACDRDRGNRSSISRAVLRIRHRHYYTIFTIRTHRAKIATRIYDDNCRRVVVTTTSTDN